MSVNSFKLKIFKSLSISGPGPVMGPVLSVLLSLDQSFCLLRWAAESPSLSQHPMHLQAWLSGLDNPNPRVHPEWGLRDMRWTQELFVSGWVVECDWRYVVEPLLQFLFILAFCLLSVWIKKHLFSWNTFHMTHVVLFLLIMLKLLSFWKSGCFSCTYSSY